MRTMIVRQHLVRVAAAAASVALVAACAPQHQATNPQGTPGPAPGGAKISYHPGMVLISNGTETVLIGDVPVTFPTKVSDAAWSPDGSRIAFVDGDANIATARPDGTGLIVLTKAAAGVVRARPAWQSPDIIFEERKANVPGQLMAVYANGSLAPFVTGEFEVGYAGFEGDEHPADSAPSTSAGTGDGRELAFQRKGSKGAEVWVADLNGRTPWSQKVADGSQPGLSPDGTKVAYVATNGQITVASTDPESTAKPIQITFGVAAPVRPTWLPDGAQVAFSTAAGVESVAATTKSGATSNATTRLATASGVATFLAPARDQLVRITGADPVALSIAESQMRWPTVAEYQPSEARLPADGAILAGTGVTARQVAGTTQFVHGPVLITGAAKLDPRVKAELKRIFGNIVAAAAGGYPPRIRLVGGTDVISAATEQAVRDLGFETQRVLTGTESVSGDDLGQVFIVSADDSTNILAAGRGTTLLSNGSFLPTDVRAFLGTLEPDANVYALDTGARNALASSWSGKPSSLKVTPLLDAGAVLHALRGDTGTLVIVDRSSLTDLAVAGGIASGMDATVLVVDGKAGLNPAVQEWLERASGSVDTTYLVDSTHAIGADTERKLGTALSGPLGYATSANPTLS